MHPWKQQLVEPLEDEVVLTQPTHQVSSRLEVEGAVLLQHLVLELPLHHSWVVVWLLRHLPQRPLVAELAQAFHLCLLVDPRDPVGPAAADSDSSQEGQSAC